MRLLIAAAPGGEGTQGERLAAEYGDLPIQRRTEVKFPPEAKQA